MKARAPVEKEVLAGNHCLLTKAALAVEFPPYTTPTFGLPRSAIPIEPCLVRYFDFLSTFRSTKWLFVKM